jgi:hypothetical protein
MQLILAIWQSAASTYWHNIQMLRSFVTVIKPFLTLIIQSLLINKINLYHIFLTKKKKINTWPWIMPVRALGHRQGHGVRAPCMLGRVTSRSGPAGAAVHRCMWIHTLAIEGTGVHCRRAAQYVCHAERAGSGASEQTRRGDRTSSSLRARAGLQKRHRRREGRGRWVFCLGLLIDVCVPPSTVREASRRMSSSDATPTTSFVLAIWHFTSTHSMLTV